MEVMEEENPYRVIEQFFQMAHLPEVKEMLQEIFQSMVNRSYNYPVESIKHQDMVYFFERLEKLVEAAHILEEKKSVKVLVRLEVT